MKNLLFLYVICICIIGAGCVRAGEINMPSAPSYETSASGTSTCPSDKYLKKTSTTGVKSNTAQTVKKPAKTDPVKERLDSIATSMLQAGESGKNITPYVMQMQDLGATVYQPQIVRKQTSHCPAIKISVNGTVKSGSMCALTGYKYKDKKYDVGYCK